MDGYPKHSRLLSKRMQHFELLTKSQIEQIHEATLEIMERIGIDFRHPPALDILAHGGAKVDGSRVFFFQGYGEGKVAHGAIRIHALRAEPRA